jgi:hypothetical protein
MILGGTAKALARSMPHRPRVDPLSTAGGAPEASIGFRNKHILGQRINVCVRL